MDKMNIIFWVGGSIAATILLYLFVVYILGLRIIPNNKFAVVERWWSNGGSLKDGIIALNGEAGFLPDVLRGGIHFKSALKYKVHQFPLITIPQGEIGYVFARSGQVLPQTQLFGRKVEESNHFQDAKGFLLNSGYKGPQLEVLPSGVYAINVSQFIVLTSKETYYLPLGNNEELSVIEEMRNKIASRDGFNLVVISGSGNNNSDYANTKDVIGIVTVHDGPSIPNGEIIAPIVGGTKNDSFYHNNFQDAEKFLDGGGYRGKQLQVLTSGSFAINRLFASIEYVPKTLVPVGYVGVVVSYTGDKGEDTSGDNYKHGTLVKEGCKGVWEKPLMPGLYPFNTQAGEIRLVPTINIMLKWFDEAGDHKYDSELAEINLITKDAFEPLLPLSVVIHISCDKAPWVIQRFGDMKKLVNQTLDPYVSAYFRNVAQDKTLLQLISDRAVLQTSAIEEMGQKFLNYNLELEDVLIGAPKSPANDDKMDIILEQLRERQVAEEKIKTFESQQKAAVAEKKLKEAQAIAEQQSNLTASSINIQVETNRGEAEARKAEQEAQKIKTLAAAEAEKIRTIGLAEANKIENIGKAQAEAIECQVNAYGNPEYPLKEKIFTVMAKSLAESKSPITPQTVVNMGGANGQSGNVFEMLASLESMKRLGVDLSKTSNEHENQVEKEETIKKETTEE
ncbi:SPFH domain-containing protein [Clostridium sp. SHJSY1]|uniref:SPFH domain-containing protein n=1 Tax=Clostridium sp. SHJSY1 TaxID=2942483 RepID=UPI0028747BC4|nr:SPFH domain-containing protein [Clostridium sp. SHJSY1]MDS0525696.1 SPFH domain-containing protein [Clostridium sp. SHJSY1]